MGDANRYPDGGAFLLHERIASKLSIAPENIVIGFGSSELIDLAARALLRDGLEGITSEGTFPLFRIFIAATGARLTEIPLREYAFDLEAIADSVTPQTRVIYLANPNNPTGTMFTAAALDAFLGRMPDHVLVVLDEAYYDYVEQGGYSRSIEQVREGHNLLVLRTFSKVYGLAGIRIGYGIAARDLVSELNKLRTPFNTSNLAQAAALAALDDDAHVRKSVEANRAGLRLLLDGAAKLGLRAIASHANFVLMELSADANAIADELLGRGVIVRPMSWMGFPRAIRVSVGTLDENERFLGAMAEISASMLPAPESLRS